MLTTKILSSANNVENLFHMKIEEKTSAINPVLQSIITAKELSNIV